MALPFIVLGAIATVVAGNAAYDYLFPDNDLPDVGDTTNLPDGVPYVPPFVGGQCDNVSYTVRISFVSLPSGVRTAPFTGFSLTGAIQSITPFNAPDSPNGDTSISGIRGIGKNGTPVFFASNGNFARDFQVEAILGSPNNCGDVPNPNPTVPLPIPDGGIPQNGTPATTPDDQLVENGLPVVFAPSILSLLAGLAAQLGSAIANAAAAADALAATKAVADAVDALAKMLDAHKGTLDKLRQYLNKKEKEDEAKKRYFIRQYGTILRDGYLDITPRPAPDGFKPLMLDFLCSNVPRGMGRFFGAKSYNWFRYQELGSICFLSPTMGVLSIHKIEQVRTSLAIPELAIGFTYNMGLNGVIRARVSMLYTQEKA